MIKNIVLYLVILAASFGFSIFYYAWFSWLLLLAVLCVPVLSLIMSLPFMIMSAVRGFYVYSEQEEIKSGERAEIKISSGKKAFPLCPRLKIRLRAENKFSCFKKSYTLYGSGDFKTPASFKFKSAGSRCGCVDFRVKSCRVYDFLGLFFIHAKSNKLFKLYVMPVPEKPYVLPDFDKIHILGYKPKKSGLADEYELREYQNGDSLKSIHWKLSSGSDKLIVRAPAAPVTKELVIFADLSGKISSPESIAARLLYTLRFLSDKSINCVASGSSGKTSLIESDTDAVNYLKLCLFEGKSYKSCSYDLNNSILFKISDTYEEVSEA